MSVSMSSVMRNNNPSQTAGSFSKKSSLDSEKMMIVPGSLNNTQNEDLKPYSSNQAVASNYSSNVTSKRPSSTNY